MASVHLQTNLANDTISRLLSLDGEERQLIDALKQFAKKCRDWSEYRNYYIEQLHKFYTARGRSRSEIIRTPAWQLAQRIGAELQQQLGDIEVSDYRDELEDLIRTGFRSRREFCQATGLSEDMLSHVLAKRKDYSLHTLSDALAKVGLKFTIEPYSNVLQH